MSRIILLFLFEIIFRTGQNCGSNLEATNQTQNFTSPGYPIVYFDNLNCVWNITARSGYYIYLAFISFRTFSTDLVFVSKFVLRKSHCRLYMLYSIHNKKHFFISSDIRKRSRFYSEFRCGPKRVKIHSQDKATVAFKLQEDQYELLFKKLIVNPVITKLTFSLLVNPLKIFFMLTD